MSDPSPDLIALDRAANHRALEQLRPEERFRLMFDYQVCQVCGHKDALDVLKCDECGADFPSGPAAV
jgi:ribosomal protein L40E